MTATSYEDAYPNLHRLALARGRRLLGNDADAEDVAQESLLRAYSAWDTIAEYAEAWVTKVATNLAISRTRSQDREQYVHPQEAKDQWPEGLDVQRALATLPARQREVAILRHIADLPEDEVAAILGISVGAVKRHLHRAIAALRRLPTLAAGRPGYNFRQQGLMIFQWLAERVLPAPEPPAGWPAPPWDHCLFVDDEGFVERRAVNANGDPILDADGNRVSSGQQLGYVLCKPLDHHKPPSVVVSMSGLSGEVMETLERSREIAVRFGSDQTYEQHVALALTERLSDPRPLWMGPLKRGMALQFDGPHADARLRVFADREASGWVRPPRDDVIPPDIKLGRLIKEATREAAKRAELATCRDLLYALLMPAELPHPPPPPQVLMTLRYGLEDRYPPAVEFPEEVLSIFEPEIVDMFTHPPPWRWPPPGTDIEPLDEGALRAGAGEAPRPKA